MILDGRSLAHDATDDQDRSKEIDHRFIEDLTVGYLGEEHRPMGRYRADLPGEHTTLVLDPETWHAWDYN